MWNFRYNPHNGEYITFARATGDISPIARPDSANINEDTSIDILVTSNDTEPNYQSMSGFTVSGFADATTLWMGTGVLRVIPNANFCGTITGNYFTIDPNSNISNG
jgi:beta-lactam-binding protein with PASTA domain